MDFQKQEQQSIEQQGIMIENRMGIGKRNEESTGMLADDVMRIQEQEIPGDRRSRSGDAFHEPREFSPGEIGNGENIEEYAAIIQRDRPERQISPAVFTNLFDDFQGNDGDRDQKKRNIPNLFTGSQKQPAKNQGDQQQPQEYIGNRLDVSIGPKHEIDQ
jgi:hypothetical protein